MWETVTIPRISAARQREDEGKRRPVPVSFSKFLPRQNAHPSAHKPETEEVFHEHSPGGPMGAGWEAPLWAADL